MGYGHSQSEETRAKISAARKGIPITDKQRLARMGHYVSPEACAKMSVAQMGHFVSPEMRMKISVAVWRGGTQVWTRKSKAKRRMLGFVPMNQPFDGCEAHHINQSDIIYIPSELHRSISHNQWTGRGMEQINALATAWLTSELTQ